MRMSQDTAEDSGKHNSRGNGGKMMRVACCENYDVTFRYRA